MLVLHHGRNMRGRIAVEVRCMRSRENNLLARLPLLLRAGFGVMKILAPIRRTAMVLDDGFQEQPGSLLEKPEIGSRVIDGRCTLERF